MHKQFSKTQQKKIDRLYRKEKWSIRAIARILQVSDKRVSAYLRREKMAGEEPPCTSACCHGKHKTTKAIDPFCAMGKKVAKWADDALCDCAAYVHETIMDCIKNVLVAKKNMTKKEIEKVLDKQLNGLYGFLGSAMSKVALATFWSLPASTKKVWIGSIFKEPSANT